MKLTELKRDQLFEKLILCLDSHDMEIIEGLPNYLIASHLMETIDNLEDFMDGVKDWKSDK